MRLFSLLSKVLGALHRRLARANSGRYTRQRWARAGQAGLLILLMLAQISAQRQPANDPEKLNSKAMLEFARLGRGFLVWERFQDQSWQIWSKQIDGTSEERLVPAEPGHDHFCPKISPDGKLLAYMSYPTGSNAYPSSQSNTGALWLMNLLNGTCKLIVPEARSYGEDRAVMWRNNKTFCYVSSGGETMETTLEKTSPRKVINFHDDHFGYLPSPDLRNATSGVPEFAVVQPDGSLVHQKLLEGCQPYFTSDSLWGYWMDGSGGPVGAMFLPTRNIHHILAKKDERLPEDRNYVYFPMISQCMRLFAFGASTNQHSHFEGNYDIFLALINPVSLKLLGKPVRYTKADGCDRYPDVFRRELELGTHFIESMGKVGFTPERGNLMCDFDFGDGTTGRGRTAEHVYKKPGDYWPTATFGKGTHRRQAQGFVHVDPPAPPELVQTRRESDRTLLVKFDRKVDLSAAEARIGTGAPIHPEGTMAGHALRLQLPASIPSNATLTLEGVRSGAGSGSPLPRTELPLSAVDWPATQDGLLFAWENAFTRDSAGAAGAGMLLPRGVAFWDQRGAMKLRGGSCVAADGGKRISEACARSNSFTFEAVVTPQPLTSASKESVILSLSEAGATPNLVMRQRGRMVSLDLFCSGAGSGDTEPLNDIFSLDPRESHHVAVVFADGEITAFVDGRKRRTKEKSLGGLFRWKPQSLRFGAAADGGNPWRGLLERVAFYDRALTAGELETHAENWGYTAESRTNPHEWLITARLVETTRPPTLADIQPYKEALVRQLYEVEQNIAGDGSLPKQIAVTQWVWLAGLPMPAQSLKRGDKVQLTIHESTAHPELKPLVIKDDLTQGLDARQFHDAGEWDQRAQKE